MSDEERGNIAPIIVGEGDNMSSISSLFMSGTSMTTIKSDIAKFVEYLKPMVKDEFVEQFNQAMNGMIDGLMTSSTSTKKIYSN